MAVPPPPPPPQLYTAFLTAMDCDVGFISAVIQLLKAPTLMGRGLSVLVMVRLSTPGGRVVDSGGADIFFARLMRRREEREWSQCSFAKCVRICVHVDKCVYVCLHPHKCFISTRDFHSSKTSSSSSSSSLSSSLPLSLSITSGAPPPCSQADPEETF